jgi:hypothetical protein
MAREGEPAAMDVTSAALRAELQAYKVWAASEPELERGQNDPRGPKLSRHAIVSPCLLAAPAA